MDAETFLELSEPAPQRQAPGRTGCQPLGSVCGPGDVGRQQIENLVVIKVRCVDQFSPRHRIPARLQAADKRWLGQ